MEEQPVVSNQIQQPPLKPLTPKPNHWLIAAIILAAIVFLPIVFILLLNSQKSTSTPPSSISPTQPPTTDETANWKTYRNEEFGFQVKYPIDFNKDEISQTVILYKGEKLNAPPGSSADRYYNTIGLQIMHRKDCDCEGFQLENVTIAGYPALKSALGNNITVSLWIYSEDRSKLVRINYFIPEDKKTPQNEETLNQILSTFKFTN